MKYLLLMYGGPVDRADGLAREVAESGEWLDGAAIADPALARTVRVRDGVVAASPSPYPPGPGRLAGY